MPINIREIQEADLDVLSTLYVSVFSGPPWNEEWHHEWALARLTDICEFAGFYGLLVEDNAQVIAGVLGRSLPFKGRKEYEMIEFFVNSERQGEGIGKQLITTLETSLKQQGHAFCTLLTGKGTDAEFFYKRNGYKISEGMLFMAHEL
ncbi:MAG: GNAT family N-acetyltransferase [Pseudomonadota bacterium]